jgi:hypothetical protein
MQNKPNLLDAQMNVTSYMKSEYEELDTWLSGKNKAKQSQNKPKQSQYKPNSRNAKMKLNFYSTKDYENERLCRCGQNKPNQTQPAVSLPVLSLSKGSNPISKAKNPKKTKFSLNQNDFGFQSC